jgi:dephospho-CoA kinase
MLASQLPVSEKAALADIVIDNSGSADELLGVVQTVYETLLQKLHS